MGYTTLGPSSFELDPSMFDPNARAPGGGGALTYVQPGQRGYDPRGAGGFAGDPFAGSSVPSANFGGGVSAPSSGLSLPSSFYGGGSSLTIGRDPSGFSTPFGSASMTSLYSVTGVGSASGSNILDAPVPNVMGGNKGTAGSGFPTLSGSGAGVGYVDGTVAASTPQTAVTGNATVDKLNRYFGAATGTDGTPSAVGGAVASAAGSAATTAGKAIVDAASTAFQTWWQSWFARIFLIILGIIMLGIALYFLMPDKAKSAVVAVASAGRIKA